MEPSLRTLSLATNRLTELPHTVSAFTQLKTLTLHHNLLATLPPEFGAFAKLEALNISFVCCESDVEIVERKQQPDMLCCPCTLIIIWVTANAMIESVYCDTGMYWVDDVTAEP